jgi:hypothetical protein
MAGLAGDTQAAAVAAKSANGRIWRFKWTGWLRAEV